MMRKPSEQPIPSKKRKKRERSGGGGGAGIYANYFLVVSYGGDKNLTFCGFFIIFFLSDAWHGMALGRKEMGFWVCSCYATCQINCDRVDIPFFFI
jgi:hypothetical protein